MPSGKTRLSVITSVASPESPVLTRLCESIFVVLPPYSDELLTRRHVFDPGHKPFRNPFRKSSNADHARSI